MNSDDSMFAVVPIGHASRLSSIRFEAKPASQLADLMFSVRKSQSFRRNLK